MLLEHIETDLNLQLIFGLLLGLVFGVAAQISRFCLRRAVAADEGPDRAALAVWLVALGTGMGGFAIATATGFANLTDHRFLQTEIPAAAIVIGGLAFGAGMVLTRGCVSRLTVLSASGNLRALTVLVVLAITAHATAKGVLAPLRTALSGTTMDLPIGTLAAIPGMIWVAPTALLATALWLGVNARARSTDLGLGAVIGALVVVGWIGTSTLLQDDFDPTPIQSLAFTQPWFDSLFFVLASTAVPAGFGTGLIAGVLIGAFLSAFARRETLLVSFRSPEETLRYGAGGALMGIGGVLAGGCTVGAGLSGGAALSLSAFLALAAIVTGAMITQRILRGATTQPALA